DSSTAAAEKTAVHLCHCEPGASRSYGCFTDLTCKVVDDLSFSAAGTVPSTRTEAAGFNIVPGEADRTNDSSVPLTWNFGWPALEEISPAAIIVASLLAKPFLATAARNCTSVA